LKSFIPASAGEVVPIQWDISSFLALRHQMEWQGKWRVRPALRAANRTDGQISYQLFFLYELTGEEES
jgi:hypothetical protein